MGIIQADLSLYIDIDPTYNKTKYYKVLILVNESITNLIKTDIEINILCLCVLKTLYLSYFNINSKNLKLPINSLIKFNNLQQNYQYNTNELNNDGNENNPNLILLQIWKKILIRYKQIDKVNLFNLINNDKEFEYLIIIFISYSISSCIIILEHIENKNNLENLEFQLVEEIEFYNDLNNISNIIKRKEFSKLKEFLSLNKTNNWNNNNIENQQDYEFFNENYKFNIIYEEKNINNNVKDNKLKFNNFIDKFVIQEPNDSLNSMINVTYLPDTALFENYGLLYFENDDLKNKIFKQLLSSFKNKTDELNRLLLFHGSPGTGKTSLSKSMSNLICCYLNKKGLIIEISISQLFSTYINQSDKNLDNLFNEIINYCQINKKFLIFLLIDEIESIVRSRDFLINSNKDSKLLSSISNLQIVNTMLINLDKFKKINNLIMLTTTNLINNLDNAFLDRCDLIIKFEKPNLNSIFNIFKYKINELLINKILKFNNSEFFLIKEYNEILNNFNNKIELKDRYYENNNNRNNYDPSIALYKISEICFQLKLSNRIISKLVLNTLSDINQNDNNHKKNNSDNNSYSIDIILFLNNLVYYIIEIYHNRNSNDY